MYKNLKKILPAFVSVLIFASGFIYFNLIKNNIAEPESQMSPRSFLYFEKFGESDRYTSEDITKNNTVTNIRVNEYHGVSEPIIKCNPADKNKLVISSNDFSIDDNYARIFTSENIGADWKAGKIELSPEYNSSSYSDPYIEYDRFGNLYYSAVQYDLQHFKNEGVFFSKSTDNGKTWNTESGLLSANVSAHLKIDVPKIFISSNNIIYVYWTEISGYNSSIKFVLSRDFGKTFTESNAAVVNRAHFSSMIEDKDGNLYLAYLGKEENIDIVKSFDEGNSWISTGKRLKINTAGRTFENKNLIKYDEDEGVRINSGPAVCLSENNEIFTVYSAKGKGSDHSDIYLSNFSIDRNEFSKPVRVNSDNTFNDQYMPVISKDVHGNLFVFYQDSRNDINNESTESFISVSADGGKTFTDHNMSTSPFYPSQTAIDKYFGDYNSFIISENQLTAVWTDSRNGKYDLYTGIIKLEYLVSR